MHVSIQKMLLGEHFEVLKSFGLNINEYFKLDTAKRHAFAISAISATSKTKKAAVLQASQLIEINGGGVPLSALLHPGTVDALQGNTRPIRASVTIGKYQGPTLHSR